MKRALILVEGQTEEQFVKHVLREHFWARGLDLQPTLLVTRKVRSGGHFKGGVTTFEHFDRDIRRLLASARDGLVTTMIDYYGLPHSFPGMEDRPRGNPEARALHVERSLARHFGAPQGLRPYLSLHEFESLLFSDPEALPGVTAMEEALPRLQAICQAFPNPEDINEHPTTAPSKRILDLFPGYRKPLHGTLAAQRIGLATMRRACKHFDAWITGLETWASA